MVCACSSLPSLLQVIGDAGCTHRMIADACFDSCLARTSAESSDRCRRTHPRRLAEVIPDVHLQHCPDAGEGVNHHGDQRAVTQARERARVDERGERALPRGLIPVYGPCLRHA